MTLSITDQNRVTRGLMRHWSNLFEGVALADKQHLLDAVQATDNWIDDNQAGYNAALPIAARNNLTAAQKTLLFCAVAIARVSIAALRRFFGEVD